MTQTNEAEARIVEAILNTGSDYMTGARKQVTQAFALFKERAEMRTGELEAQLELAKVRDEQRKEALASMEKELNTALEIISDMEDRERELEVQVAMLEDRERELDARAERAEAREAEARGCSIVPRDDRLEVLVRFVRNCSFMPRGTKRENAWSDHVNWYDAVLHHGDEALTDSEVDLVRALLDA